MTQTPQAGWYPNPEGAGQRYWDGAAWTDQFSAPGPLAPPAGAPAGKPAVQKRRPPVLWICFIAAIGMIAGGAGPWLKFEDLTSNGTDGHDGGFIIFAALVALILLIIFVTTLARGTLIAVGVIAILMTIVSIADLADISGKKTGLPDGSTFSAGWGIYLSVAACAVLAISAFMAHRASVVRS
jgi:hypothetical protein